MAIELTETQKSFLLRLHHPLNNEKIIRGFSNAELRQCYKELKCLFCNEKGYWQLRKYRLILKQILSEKIYLESKKKYTLFDGIEYFGIEYNSRIKELQKGFLAFVFKVKFANIKMLKGIAISPQVINEGLKLHNIPLDLASTFANIALKDKKDIYAFLFDLKELKTKYLNCSDEHFFDFIFDNIYTTLNKSTLKKMYYNS
jgi:hypothetical protein